MNTHLKRNTVPLSQSSNRSNFSWHRLNLSCKEKNQSSGKKKTINWRARLIDKYRDCIFTSSSGHVASNKQSTNIELMWLHRILHSLLVRLITSTRGLWGIGRDWLGILTCWGFNPSQSPPNKPSRITKYLFFSF